jgi:hypothetical protein
VLEIGKAAGFANDIEQIAMLTGGGIGPLASGAFAGQRPFEPHEH